MARCPLCSERSAKRYCPAKGVSICAICCGGKREIEIDCPGNCPHLHAGYSYEARKRSLDNEMQQLVQQFDQRFLQRFSTVLNALGAEVLTERQNSQWLVDQNVIEAYKGLAATLKTLEGGIYYESLPAQSSGIPLFHRLRGLFEAWMKPQLDVRHETLKASEATSIANFLVLTATLNTSGRPRSRQYLEWLGTLVQAPASAEPPTSSSSSLILP